MGVIRGWAAPIVVALGLTVVLVPSVGAASGNPIKTVGQAARSNAALFISASGCPVTLGEVKFGGRVTKANRAGVVQRVIDKALVAKAKDGVCTAVARPKNISKAQEARYRKVVRQRADPGDLLISEVWLGTNGGKYQTLAVYNQRGDLRFDPLISTFARPAPAPVLLPPSATARVGLSARDGQTGGTGMHHKWDNTVVVATNILGGSEAIKQVNMNVYTNADGNIVSHSESVFAGGVWLTQAQRRIRVESVTRDGCECEKLTVEVYYASGFAGIRSSVGTGGFDKDLAFTGVGSTGVDVEVFTLCANGRASYG